jgi:hypothetical protein
MGVTSILVLLLSLGGFGVAPDPAAPPPAEILKYAPEDAEIFLYLDAAAVLPKNWQALEKLPDAPATKGSREASQAIGRLVSEARAVRDKVRAQAGFDPVTDVATAAAFVRLHGDQDPDVLVVLRGQFPSGSVDHMIGSFGGTRSVMAGRPMLTSPDGKMAIAQGADGALLGGSVAWVKERTGAYAPKRSAIAPVATAGLDGKPFFYTSVRLAPPSLLFSARNIRDPLALDFLNGATDVSLGLHANGISASFGARTASGYARGLLAVDGVVEMLRAGHHYLRAFARLGAAAVDSYAAADRQIAAIVAHKAEILALLDTTIGDGNFQVAIDKREAERRAGVRLTGKSLGDVLPMAGLVLPIAIVAYAVDHH